MVARFEMYLILDILLTLLHLALILFNTLGWIWRKTRKAHLITIGLTAISWFGLGIWFGWGYCFLTDWHWKVKTKLGETHLPNSLIKYYADKITGMNINSDLIDMVTLAVFLSSILMSGYVNIFLRKKTA